MESLNFEAASFVPLSHVPVRGQSSSTGLPCSHSPPTPTRPGLSTSIHAPSLQRKGSRASIHAPSSLPRPDSSTSIHAPSSSSKPDLSASIHTPCTTRSLNDSIHAPSQHPRGRSKPWSSRRAYNRSSSRV